MYEILEFGKDLDIRHIYFLTLSWNLQKTSMPKKYLPSFSTMIVTVNIYRVLTMCQAPS